MILDEDQPLISKVFQYFWKDLINDGYASEENVHMKRGLLDWFKKQYKVKGRYPRYPELILYISGM